jgi:hypothetical protein
MTNKLKPYTLKPLASKKVIKLVDEVNVLYDKTWKSWIKLGKKLKELNDELKKDGMSALPEVEKRLCFRWSHAVRLLKVVDSPLLKDKEIRNRLPKEVGTLLEITRMNKSILAKALKTNIPIRDEDGTKRTVPLIRPDMIRSEIQNFRMMELQKINNNTGYGIRDRVDYTIKISFDKKISSNHLKKKLNELEAVSEGNFKVDIGQVRFSNYLKKPTRKRIK